MSNGILIEEIGTAMIVRFDRPDIRSPLSVGVIEELSAIVSEAANEPGVERLIFTGEGDVFASGADLREIANVDREGAPAFARRGQDLMNRIAELPIDTVAAVNGICFGGALDLALACKRRIASPHAVFAHPGANLGIITGWGGTQRLPRLIGQAAALEMFFSARRIDAIDALALGLVDEVVDEPLTRALETCFTHQTPIK